MSDAKPSEDNLFVALLPGRAIVQVYGRGTFKVSGRLKKFGQAVIKQNCITLILDMTNCVGMDSTFMGVIAGLATELQQENEGRISLINLSDKTQGLLTTLGLDQMVDTHLEGATPPDIQKIMDKLKGMDSLEATESTRLETAQTMLEAHENLVSCTPENYPRFKDVLTFLKEDLEQLTNE